MSVHYSLPLSYPVRSRIKAVHVSIPLLLRDMDVLFYSHRESMCDNRLLNTSTRFHITIVSKMRSNAPRSDHRISDWLRNLKCCKHFSGVYLCVSNNSDVWHSVRPLAKVPVIVVSLWYGYGDVEMLTVRDIPSLVKLGYSPHFEDLFKISGYLCSRVDNFITISTRG